MKNTITIDLETIPCQRTDVRDHMSIKICKETKNKLETVKAPANYKDSDKIAAYIEDAKKTLLEGEEQAIEEAVNKTGLNGAFGQIVCIGFAIGDSEPDVLYGMDEHSLLRGMNELLDSIPANMHNVQTIVGHNVLQFDLRFLLQRYIVNGVRPHAIVRHAAEAKPWETTKVFDTMTQFVGIGNRISLDDLCFALNIEGKGGINGADVWPMVKAGKLSDVASYCKHDISITRNAYKRMTFKC